MGSKFIYVAMFDDAGRHYLAMIGWKTEWSRGVTSNVRLRCVGRQYLDNSGFEDRTITPWTTVDLSFWLDLARLGISGDTKPTAFFHLRNLSDEEYETTGYYNVWGGADYSGENHFTTGPGRNFAAGVSATF